MGSAGAASQTLEQPTVCNQCACIMRWSELDHCTFVLRIVTLAAHAVNVTHSLMCAMQRYAHRMQQNEKHGSFYLQSKVFRAKERIEQEVQEAHGGQQEQEQEQQQQQQ